MSEIKFLTFAWAWLGGDDEFMIFFVAKRISLSESTDRKRHTQACDSYELLKLI